MAQLDLTLMEAQIGLLISENIFFANVFCISKKNERSEYGARKRVDGKNP